MMAHPLALSSVRIDGKKGEQKRKTFTPAPGVVYTKHNHDRNEGGALHLHDLACLIRAINVSVRICEHDVFMLCFCSFLFYNLTNMQIHTTLINE